MTSSSSSSYKHLTTPDQYESLVSEYDVFLFDCDGVLWSGDDLLPNVKSVLDKLRKRGKEIIFVTNNASKSRKALMGKFDKLGIPAQEVSAIVATCKIAQVTDSSDQFPCNSQKSCPQHTQQQPT